MVGANTRAIRYRSRKFGQMLPVPINSAHVGNAPIFFVIRSVEVATTALGDLDDRMVVLLRDLRDEIVDALRPDFQPCFCQRALGGHGGSNSSVRIACASGVRLNLRSAETSAHGTRTARIGHDATRVVMEPHPVERSLKNFF